MREPNGVTSDQKRLADLRKMARTQAYLVRSEVAELFDHIDHLTEENVRLKTALGQYAAEAFVASRYEVTVNGFVTVFADNQLSYNDALTLARVPLGNEDAYTVTYEARLRGGGSVRGTLTPGRSIAAGERLDYEQLTINVAKVCDA